MKNPSTNSTKTLFDVIEEPVDPHKQFVSDLTVCELKRLCLENQIEWLAELILPINVNSGMSYAYATGQSKRLHHFLSEWKLAIAQDAAYKAEGRDFKKSPFYAVAGGLKTTGFFKNTYKSGTPFFSFMGKRFPTELTSEGQLARYAWYDAEAKASKAIAEGHSQHGCRALVTDQKINRQTPVPVYCGHCGEQVGVVKISRKASHAELQDLTMQSAARFHQGALVTSEVGDFGSYDTTIRRVYRADNSYYW